jgi:Tol biopolymer transport system component
VKGPQFFRRRRGKTLALPWAIAGVLALAAVFLSIKYKAASPPPTYQRLTFEAGTIYSARFAPEGQSIIYSAAWDNKSIRLFSTVGNSNLSQPLQFADANLLSISRTNELALVLGGSHNGQLETMNGMLADAPLAAGSPREVLSDVRWADWDSNGKLAVVHWFEGHCRIEYPIGNVLYQSGGWISNIRFSPKGDAIAFMDHPALWDNRGTVRLVDLSGHVRTLTQEWDSESGLAWRPDGKEIWFTAIEKGNTLNLRAVTLSRKLRTLLDLPMAITVEDISSDGRVLISLNSKRLAMAYTTLGERDGIDLSWHDWNSARDISADGKLILFEDSSEAAGAGYAVAARDVDGSLPVRLGEGSAGGLSPDGKWAISVSTNEAPQITLLPTGAGQPRTINVSGLAHIHPGWARFMPDGQRLAVNGYEVGQAPHCYVIDPSGRAKPATSGGVLCGPVSPDSRSIVGVSPDRSIALYSLDGGGLPRLIPHLQNNFVAVQWSDNGSSLFGYHTGEFPSKVYRVDIQSGAETVVQELKPGVPAGVVLVAPIVVSRDGRRFAYSYNQTLSALYLVSGLH